ncbi:MAG: response regulator [Thermodesulfobacteriota bacterium]
MDDDEMRNLYAKHISNKGFEVKTGSNGEDALQKLTEFMPKVIILDVSMPNMVGMQMLRMMKKLPALAKIPVIMITAREALLPFCLDTMAGNYPYKGSNSAKELLTTKSMLIT